MISEQIPPALAGERVDRLVALVAGVSRSDASATVAAGGVRLDGDVVTTGKLRVRLGQVLEVDPSVLPAPSAPEPEPEVEFEVVHEDPDLIVVDKPPWLVVHPAAGHAYGTLVNGLLARFPDLASVGDPTRPGIVHRLDAGTSGLLVVARTPLAYETLVAALSRREVTRRYEALVWGTPEAASGVIDAPIGRDPRDPLRMAVVVGGRAARTRFEVVRRFTRPVVSLVACQLETGRTHQIRVHLAATGHPVVGDGFYGGVRGALECPRPFLHAAHLAFEHPRTGEQQVFDSPLPDDLRQVLDRCAG